MDLLIQELSGNSGLFIYATAFFILLACGFGFPMPEDVVLLTLGVLSYSGEVELGTSIAVAMLGVLIGDSTIFFIGRYYGEKVLRIPGFRRVFTPARVDRVRAAFRRGGNIYLFFARFTPGLRSVTFWTAGLVGVPFRTFFLMDGTAALISVPLFTYLGYWMGEAFDQYLDQVRDFAFWLGLAGFVVIALYTWSHIRRQRQETATRGSSDLEM